MGIQRSENQAQNRPVSNFKTTAYGKWILAGEHAVLRGYPALVFPCHARQLTLTYRHGPENLTIQTRGNAAALLENLFLKTLAQAQNQFELRGQISLESTLPIGHGMGASAAICVVTTRLLQAQGLFKDQTTRSVATTLEHAFHGQSSGLDVAGVEAQTGLIFQQGQTSAIHARWQPKLYLSASGVQGLTSTCIEKVKALWARDSVYAQAIDQRMGAAVDRAVDALETDHPTAFNQLKTALDEGLACFESFDLVNEPLQQQMQDLRKAGAVAVKPTGSGLGGYLISLWEETPPKTTFELIKLRV